MLHSRPLGGFVPGSSQNSNVMQLGNFEIDLQSGELRRSGLKIKLQEQPFQVLVLLLEHPGEVVTREELRRRLWPADTFVDFDHSLNSAVKKLRQALGDDSDHPRFIETLPRRGYRLIVPVTGAVPVLHHPVEEVPPTATKRARVPYSWLSIAAVIIVSLGALTVWKTIPRPLNAPRVVRFTNLTNDGQSKSGPLTTDGSRIYFNETLPGPHNVIVQVAIKGGDVSPLLVSLKQPSVLDLSSEGTDLLVASDEGSGLSSLWILPVAGGSPRRVGTTLARNARFGGDAASIVYSDPNGGVFLVNRDGSYSRKLLSVAGTPFAFAFSPDGRTMRFTEADPQSDDMAIMEASADGTGVYKMFSGSFGKWTTDGRFYIYENRPERRVDLWTLPEGRSFFWRRREHNPIQLTAGPLNFEDAVPSKDGKEIFAIGTTQRSEVIRYDSRGGQFVPYLAGISAEGLAFSNDGQWVTYTSYPDGMLWRSKMDGTDRLQLTFAPMRALLPRWSPDRRHIAFSGVQPGTSWNVYVVPSEGGTPEVVVSSKQGQVDVNWAPDGNSLVFGTFNVPGMPIYVVDLQSKRVSTLPGSNGIFSPRWSPDGRYVAGIDSESISKLMVFDYITQKWTEVFGSEIGYLSWSHDGKYIYFQDSRIPPRKNAIASYGFE